jgi:hypothetical protein
VSSFSFVLIVLSGGLSKAIGTVHGGILLNDVTVLLGMETAVFLIPLDHATRMSLVFSVYYTDEGTRLDCELWLNACEVFPYTYLTLLR